MIIILAIIIAAFVLYAALKIQLAARKAARFYWGEADGTELSQPVLTPVVQPRFYYGEVQ